MRWKRGMIFLAIVAALPIAHHFYSLGVQHYSELEDAAFALDFAKLEPIPEAATLLEVDSARYSWIAPSISVTFRAEQESVSSWVRASPSLREQTPETDLVTGAARYRLHFPGDDYSEGTTVTISKDGQTVDVSVFLPHPGDS